MKKLRLSFIILLVFLIMVLNYPGSNDLSVSAAEDVDFNIVAETPYTIVKVGASVDIIANATANGIKVNDFIYKAGNKKIATVNTKGKITAVSPGECKINVSSKKYSKCDSYNIDIKVVERVIKISGPKKYEAGKTYTLKASEKNVTWRLYNTDGDSAKASIDPSTGKIKVRNAGSFYVECSSNNGKGLGGVYIYAVGPVIEEQVILLDPIIIDDDLHVASETELYAIDQLPKTVTVPYQNQGKYGEVEVKILWGGGWRYSWDYHRDEGYYIISGWFDIPEGYRYLGDIYELKKNVQICIILTTAQTDVRKEIISIAELEPITISEDLHIIAPWYVLGNYLRDTMLLCTLEDGSVVELPIGNIRSSEITIKNEGIYECKLRPVDTPGYSTKDDPYAKLTVVIKKEQTSLSKSECELNLDTIAPYSWVTEFTSQVPLGKKQM